jgi:hypothetical protein
MHGLEENGAAYPDVNRWTATQPIIVAWGGEPTFGFATD